MLINFYVFPLLPNEKKAIFLPHLHYIMTMNKNTLLHTLLLATVLLVAPFRVDARTNETDALWAERLQKEMKDMCQVTDVDPDSFETRIAWLRRLHSKDEGVRRALFDVLVADELKQITSSYGRRANEDIGQRNAAEADSLYEHALAQSDVLARTNALSFVPLVVAGDDSRLMGNDLLSVVVRYVDENSGWDNERLQKMYTGAYDVFAKIGRESTDASLAQKAWNAALRMKMELWSKMRWADRKSRRLTQAQMRDSLLCLLKENVESPLAADIALRYVETLEDDVEKVKFLKWCRDSLEQSPMSPNIENELAQLLTPHVSIRGEENATFLAGEPFTLDVEHYNLRGATIEVRQYVGTRKPQGRRWGEELILTGKLLENRHLDFCAEDTTSHPINCKTVKPHNRTTVQKQTFTLAPGRYVFVVKSDGKALDGERRDSKALCEACEVNVTSMRIIGVGGHGMKPELRVVNNKTGRVVPAARLEYSENGEKVRAVLSENDRTDYVYLKSYEYYASEDSKVLDAKVFTDRAIYRPGQRVFASVLFYQQLKNETEVAQAMNVHFKLMDNQYKQVAESDAATDEWGMATAEFVVPEGTTLGQWRIVAEPEEKAGVKTRNAVAYFRVEEYKRPQFDVVFDKVKDEYSVGDTAVVGLSAKMYSGIPLMGATVEYKVTTTAMPFLRKSYYGGGGETIAEGELTTDGNGRVELPFVLTDEYAPEYGRWLTYSVEMRITSASGESHSATQTIHALRADVKEEEVPVVRNDKVYSSVTSMSPGDKTEVWVTPAKSNPLIYYYIMYRTTENGKVVDKVADRGQLECFADSVRLPFTFRREYGDGATVTFLYVKDGHFCRLSHSFRLKEPEKSLKLSWNTFRDRVKPGAEEKWVLAVTDVKGKAVSGAHVLAAMYDSALDAFAPSKWTFSLSYPRRLPFVQSFASLDLQLPSLYFSVPLKCPEAYERTFDMLRTFSVRYFDHSAPVLLASVPVMAKQSARLRGTGDVLEEAAVTNDLSGVIGGSAAEEEQAPEPATSMVPRSDFSETAFFMPRLITDKNGLAVLEFTLPESVTEWRFKAFAHTKDVDYGLLESSVVATKDFMVQPYMPRFVRMGDVATMTAQVANMCERQLSGEVRAVFKSARTEKEITVVAEPFSVEAGKTVVVSFTIDTKALFGDASMDDLICEVVASADGESDGERHLVPVLSDRVPLVENIPFYLDGEGAVNIPLDSVFNHGSSTTLDCKIGVSYTDNPALLVVDALNDIKKARYDNAIDLASSVYANTVLATMLPNLPDSIDTPEALEARLASCIQKLKSLQRSDGSFSWFPGMYGSEYITLSVCEMLAPVYDKLSKSLQQMLVRAVAYLDKQELERYERYVQNMLKGTVAAKSSAKPAVPSESVCHYMLVSSHIPHSTSARVKAMQQAYVESLEKSSDALTIFGKAKAAQIMQSWKKTGVAQRLVRSLRDYTVMKAGFGRFYNTERAMYSWRDYRLPTHIASMRAIRSVDADDPYLRDMLLWVLRQKQVQSWDNPMNTVDAAELLLSLSPIKGVMRKPQLPSVSIDGVPMNADNGGFAGIRDVSSSSVVTVKKQTPGLSWGAIKAECTDNINNVRVYSSGEITVQSRVVTPAAGGIAVGDKVTVRITVDTDRDMDMVRLSVPLPSCFEQINTLSGYRRVGGTYGYVSVHDSSAEVFFDKFRKGSHTVDIECYVVRQGDYNSGIATAECVYYPGFAAHSANSEIYSKSTK